MNDVLNRMFASDGFMPHGMCYLWRPDVLALHVISDALIVLAYFSIPFSLVYFVRKRKNLDFHWMFLCFAVFIVACGTTHALEIWTIWQPLYWLSGGVKAITALASVPTAVLLVKLMPDALSLPSPAELKMINAELRREIAERERAEREIRRMNEELESRVAERTRQLEDMNESLRREIEERHRAEQTQRQQLSRLELLNRITHAIADRQDLTSILQVVLQKLEDDLRIDFACVCAYEAAKNSLAIIDIGAKSRAAAQHLQLSEQTRFAVEDNEFARCVKGQLVHGVDGTKPAAEMPLDLARGGLHSFALVPLPEEHDAFGVLLVARRDMHGFATDEREFLGQLCEHVGLAIKQTRVYAALQQAYDDLRQSQRALLQQERLRALGEMASGIAHDINNAISPIALYAESLRERESLSVPGRKQLATMQRAIEDVANTVSRLREFYRPRETAVAQEPVDLNELVKQAVELTRARWCDVPQRDGILIHLRTNLTARLLEISGERHEIRDALTNLIFNAVDAMPNGGSLVLRTEVYDTAPPRVSVEVRDTGIGMDDETRKRCLEPFFTTKGERGTGLGLAMVYGMTQRHGAELEIESSPGAGTTVRLSFQALPSRMSSRLNTQAQPLAAKPSSILIVDDDPIVLESLRDVLQADGHQVTTVDGGQSGIDAFTAAHRANRPFDIVITDLGMPRVDGRRVAGAVRALSPATPIILLTGWGQRLVAEGNIPSEVDRVLAKPPKLHELRVTLAELMAAREPAIPQ